jgi:outer membrane protein assembly factor BamB
VRSSRARRRRPSALAPLLSVALAGCGSLGFESEESPLTGYGPTLQPMALRPAWRKVLNEGPVYREKPTERAVAAIDPGTGRVAVGTVGGWFQALSLAGGDVIWRVPVPGGVSAHAVFDQGRVLTGTDDGELLALDAASGRREWSFRGKADVTQAPTVAGGLIYFVDASNTLYAIDRNTGEWRWQYRREAPAEFALVGEARPTVDGSRVFAGFSDGVLVALAAEDGAVLWTKDLAPEHERFQDVDATPQVIDGTLYAASAASGLYALDPASGDIRWTLPQPGITGLAAYEGDLVASSDRGLLLRVDLATAKVVWQVRFESEGAPSAPTVAAGVVMVGLSRGSMYFVDPASGRVLRRFASGQGFSAPAAGNDGAVSVLSNGGVLYSFLTGAR